MGTLANSEDPDKMPHNATFYQSLHCLLRRNRWKSLNTLYEPQHEIFNNLVCASSKASDQPAHTRSLIRAFASPYFIL